MARSARVDEPVVISLVLADGEENKFPRAFIFDETGIQIQIVDLLHRGLGMYHQTFVPTIAQQYTIVTVVFSEGSYTTEDVTYYREGDVIFVSAHTEADPAVISSAVWDELLPGAHDLTDSSGLFMQVIRQTVLDIANEIVSNPTHSLSQLSQQILDNRSILKFEIDENEVKIDSVATQAATYQAALLVQHSQTQSDIANHDSNLEAKAILLSGQMTQVEIKVDNISSQMLTLSQQTQFVAIVPQDMTRPDTGTKTYQFFVAIYDVNGIPDTPDTTPTVQIFDTAGGIYLAETVMTQQGTNIGQYFYNLVLSPGTFFPVLRVEFKIVENAQTFLVQRPTEIIEFDNNLAVIESKIDTIDLTTTDNFNLLTGANGLAQLKTEILTNRADLGIHEVKLDQIKVKTDFIISNPVSLVDLGVIEAKIDALPSDSDMLGFQTIQTNDLKGSGGYNLTNIYDNQRGTDGAVLASDPRLTFLDATISSRSDHTISDVWNAGTRTLTAAAPLTTVEVAKIWDYLVTSITTTGSIGELIKIMLDEPTSTRGLTLSQLTTALFPIALEATVSTVLSTVITEANENEIKLNSILNTLALVKPQTDKIISGGAQEATVIFENNENQSLLIGLDLLVDAVKAKTDNLPIDPALESSVLQIPTNPLLDNDGRLVNLPNLSLLDVAVSSRAAVGDIPLDYAKETSLSASTGSILSAISTVQLSVDTLPQTSYFNTKFSQLDLLDDKLDLISGSGFVSGLHSLVKIKEGQTISGGGTTPADVWSYSNRELTSFPDFALVQDVDDAAEMVIDNLIDYRCNMTTTLKTNEDKQEVLCWLDRNQQTMPSVSNARVTVSDGINDIWSGVAAAPDARGIFRITQNGIAALISQPDKNFIMSITIEFNTQDFNTSQPFYTV